MSENIHSDEMNMKVSAFYASFEWRQARYSILKKSAGCCMLCNRSDLPLHVDHIKPLRKHWSLRLRLDNLQVLCEECNHGKGNWDETDWRPHSKENAQRQKVSRDKVEKQAEQKQRKFARDRYWLDQLEQEARRRMKQELSKDKRLRKKLIVKIIKKQRCGPK